MVSHLIIGDAHAKPGISNERFEWLGHLAVDRRPDVIIDMGDWADMESLCSYDVGKKSFEGRRYIKDIKAATDARERFEAPIKDHNQRYPRDLYTPRKIALGGNHDQGRIDRVCELHPELDGVISVNDFNYATYGWEYQPFLKSITVHGITYNHYFPSGVKGLPVGNARLLLAKKHQSVVQAHSHLFDFAMETCADGRKIIAMIAGCFFLHEERYAGQSNGLWWRGAILANEINNGFYDPELLRIQTIKKIYS